VRAGGSPGMVLGSLALIALGVVLLLNNFLLLSGFNVSALLPLILVAVGAVILLRGDLLSSSGGRNFGITRGSVESASLTVSAGEIDVQINALEREGRLIAGQFATDSRPSLSGDERRADLLMNRAATPWLSFANWSAALASDLPWQVFVSTHLGQVDCDLRGVIVQGAVIATGLGDIRLVCPQEAFDSIIARSALGTIHVIAPEGCYVRITVSGSRLFRVYSDQTRYRQVEPRVFVTQGGEMSRSPIEVYLSGTFGDAYLA
jgi:hypothetical protein